MTRVDFYILKQSGVNVREHFACRLAEKAYSQGITVVMLTADHEQTARVDRLLWTFRQGSFIPHACITEHDDEPVVIGTAPDTSPTSDSAVLINLTDDVPHNWAQGARVAEILDQRQTTLKPGRARYKEYQQHGCQPQTHHIDGD
ncbi:DNA polymerase III subunit chi [Halorhodospira halochloris]|uniref:DNA polymerase III subunit chi n=1 Tax=Halorhodospira halochloris TaxID=1052 RepID=UPI001EE79FC6|nr:DNA polymerase III subunit chi [Halorhodospira halochloris]